VSGRFRIAAAALVVILRGVAFRAAAAATESQPQRSFLLRSVGELGLDGILMDAGQFSARCSSGQSKRSLKRRLRKRRRT
jgi:hypothetical protein